MTKYPYRRPYHRERPPSMGGLLMTLACTIFVIFLGLSLLSGCAATPEQEERNAMALMVLGQSLQNHQPFVVQPTKTLVTTCTPSNYVGETVRCRSTMR